MIDNQNRAIGALVGLAVGDALGTTLEFHERDTKNVSDIVGGGPFQLQAGQWTDDTSMALCLGESLIQRQCFDAEDQLNRYTNWMNFGYKSSTGVCFDIGTTTRTALWAYKTKGSIYNNDHFLDAGNGSLMRLAPIPIFYSTEEKYSQEFIDLLKYSALSSYTTHANEVPVQCCIAFSIMLNRAITGTGGSFYDIVGMDNPEDFGITNETVKSTINVSNIFNKTRDDIKSTGYVIDSLEAALWCFGQTNNFEDAVLLAANLGDDADTVAAITGQLAGAFYGLDGIPLKWINIITDSDEIIELATKLYGSK